MTQAFLIYKVLKVTVIIDNTLFKNLKNSCLKYIIRIYMSVDRVYFFYPLIDLKFM